MGMLHYGVTATPVGRAVIAVSDRGLAALELTDAAPELALHEWLRDAGAPATHAPAAVAPIAAQLDEYFAGSRTAFDVPIDWRRVHGFARLALQAVCSIPYGETAGYGEVAIMAGSPGAARAVGTACARSPWSLIVPVHRVVRADGSIGRYGRSPEIKRFLLDLEHSPITGGTLGA